MIGAGGMVPQFIADFRKIFNLEMSKLQDISFISHRRLNFNTTKSLLQDRMIL